MSIQEEINKADAVVIGAGAGLSTAAGFTYSGLRFYKYFSDFAKKYGIQDMYSGGFYPYEDLETFWAWWSRAIYVNRYLDAPKNTYGVLYDLVKDKDYFVLTTNVDISSRNMVLISNVYFIRRGIMAYFSLPILLL